MHPVIKALTGVFTKMRPSEVGYRFSGNFKMTPTWTEYAPTDVIENAYHASYYFNTCVNAIIDACASVPLKVYAKEGDNWEEDGDHSLQDLLDYPNEFLTIEEMIRRIVGHHILNGNAFWLKNRVGQEVKELWPLDPLMISLKPHPKKFVVEYYHGFGSDQKTIKVKDMIHFRSLNFRSLHFGEGQVRVVQRLIDLDNDTINWQKVNLQNRGNFPAIIGVKGKLNEKQVADIERQLDEKRGDGLKAGRELIIGSELDYHRVGATSQEMDWLESRKLTRQDISMIMRVPLPLVSIYDDATLANVQQARKIFWTDRIIPLLKQLQGTINLSLTPDFGERKKLFAEFDYSGIQAVRDEMFEQAKVGNILTRIGFKPRAINRKLGMGYAEEDIVEDFLVQSGSVSNIGTAAGTREVSTAATEEPKLVAKSYLVAAAKMQIVHRLEIEKKQVLDSIGKGLNALDLSGNWYEFYAGVSRLETMHPGTKAWVDDRVIEHFKTTFKDLKSISEENKSGFVVDLYESLKGSYAEKMAEDFVQRVLYEYDNNKEVAYA